MQLKRTVKERVCGRLQPAIGFLQTKKSASKTDVEIFLSTLANCQELQHFFFVRKLSQSHSATMSSGNGNMFSALCEDFFWAKDQYLKAYQLNMMALLTFSSTASKTMYCLS